MYRCAWIVFHAGFLALVLALNLLDEKFEKVSAECTWCDVHVLIYRKIIFHVIALHAHAHSRLK